MDVEDTADHVFEKVDDKMDTEPAGETPEVLDWDELYATDDNEEDTEDELEQQKASISSYDDV